MSSCQAQKITNTAPTPFNSLGAVSKPFYIIGYVTSAIVVETIPFEKLTHLNYAFLIPNSDGSLMAFPNAWKLDNIVTLAHANNVKVLISVGGWGYDAEFETLAANDESRAFFVENLTQFMVDHHLDGIDIDWEYPDLNSAHHFLALMQELRAALPEGKLLTAAVAAGGENGDGIPAESFEIVDFLNLMIYDAEPEIHASYDYAQYALDYWFSRGLDPGKTVVGVPFYAHPNGIPYNKLILADPTAAQRDQTEYHSNTVYYNGVHTIQRKTRLAQKNAAGIMFWLLEQDTLDENSLLNAIYQTVQK